MPSHRTTSIASSLLLVLSGLCARAEETKPQAAAPVPVEVTSAEAARALDPAVTSVRLTQGSGDAVLAELARNKGLATIVAAQSAVTDQGLRALSAAASLREIDLSGCAGITASGLKSLGGLKKLEVVRLRGVKSLDDASLAPLARLTKLRLLDLSGCTGLGDGAIKALRELEALEELDLTGVPLTQQGTVHLVRIQSLKVLHLDRTGIPDPSMLEIVALRNLEVLGVSGNAEFGFVGLLHLGGLRKLRVLEASGLPDLTDEALQRAAKMETLEKLDVSDCARVTDAGISALAASPRLASLDVSRTHLTGKGLLAFAKCRSLRSLRLAGCPGVKAEDVAAARAAMPAVTISTQ